jgi:hypothetical protein
MRGCSRCVRVGQTAPYVRTLCRGEDPREQRLMSRRRKASRVDERGAAPGGEIGSLTAACLRSGHPGHRQVPLTPALSVSCSLFHLEPEDTAKDDLD